MSITQSRPALALSVLALFIGALFSAAASAQVFDAKSLTLDNGLQVVVVENDRAPVVTQLLMYKAGAMDEAPGKTGAAHVLEHMMFKGTREVAPGEFSALVAKNGGRDNAFTGHDYTGYFQSVAADRLELVMRLEADRMRNLVLDQAQFETERQVVVEERNQRIETEPGAILREQMAPALYMNHPYSRPIIGWRHELEALELQDLSAFYNTFYAPNNAVLVISGDVEFAQVRELAMKYYGPIAPSEIAPRPAWAEPPHLTERTIVLEDERVREPSWTLRRIAPSYGNDGPSEEVYALQVLMDIVGGGPTSRLYRALVIEQGIAVSAGGWYSESNRGPGSIGVWAQPAEGVSVDEVEAAARAVLEEVAAEGVAEDEVRRAVRRLQDSAATARDSLMGPAQVIARGLTIGLSLEEIEAWPERIGAVTPAAVDAAASAHLGPGPAVTTRLLPQGGEGAAAARSAPADAPPSQPVDTVEEPS
ncbi:MAG: pitrilysin family protein [Marivibrio sp.]|uniref:M16 family metallopeptidase n=1 Tax=Marivibrio sp. TaxID=2039719 RepID=UPI0032EDB3C8